jgi:hypothetical protein
MRCFIPISIPGNGGLCYEMLPPPLTGGEVERFLVQIEYYASIWILALVFLGLFLINITSSSQNF